MSRAAVLAFSERGAKTAQRIACALEGSYEVELYPAARSLSKLMEDIFPKVQALVFVGACGIAVRAVAPHLVSKASDPAVLVCDEKGEFVISLLSGHIGGANALSRRVAEALGAAAVITTATDVQGRFSVDAWAAENGIPVPDLHLAKRFSAEILKRDLPFACDFPVRGALPPGLYAGCEGDLGLAVSCRDIRPFAATLALVPRILTVGIGCKRGTPAEAIEEAVGRALESGGFRKEALFCAASIDLKRDEQGLLSWAKESGLPIRFYSAEALNALRGAFTASEFVARTAGVDNVCERAAVRCAGEGACLAVRKTAAKGVAAAIAQKEWGVCFE